MKQKTTNYHDYLLEALQNNDDIIAYLQAALNDNDNRVFLLALYDVMQARNKKGQVTAT